MRQGLVKYNNELAGILTEDDNGEYLKVEYKSIIHQRLNRLQ